MKIAYYMPFKPLGHNNPSGDLIIGTELYDFLKSSGDVIFPVSRFRCRWIYRRPHLWPLLLAEIIRVLLVCRREKPDLWLTYHSYYKSPDMIGPVCCRILGIPYVIFQGVYSTKRRRSQKTAAGFYLNRFALKSSRCVVTNKHRDEINLLRLLPRARVHYVAPGIHPEKFQFSREARENIRRRLHCSGSVVILCAAMLRPGVKSEGVGRVIRACTALPECGVNDFLLVVAGEGSERSRLEELAAATLGERAHFTGKIGRSELPEYYSAADVFVFPGIEESLGMVYLEAQSCGLPVVACGNWGAGEAVVDGVTGLLCDEADGERFAKNIALLLKDETMRREMGRAAENHVRTVHTLKQNYAGLRTILAREAKCKGKKQTA